MARFFARRPAMFGLAALALVCAFFALPQGQAAAAALLVLLRGNQVHGISTDVNHLKNAQAAFDELQQLGTVSGTLPRGLTNVSSVAQAQSVTGLSLAQPSTFPSGIDHTPTQVKAIAASGMSITFSKSKADAYFRQSGSNMTLPAQYDGVSLTANFPAVALVEYGGAGRLYVGQAGQLEIDVSPSTVDPNELRNYLLTLPTLSRDTASQLAALSNWQDTIPLGVPTDKAGWKSASVAGAFGGSGIILNDNTGIASALIWQAGNGAETLGVAGYGLKASDVQSVAGSLH
ncbi:MAG: hypothetical protein JOY61_16405 [Chloroflexi bacterium]|nr:hypothetical protein [Chloroflexota bacterium]